MNPNQCSFCGRKKSEVEILISGQNGFICENCVEQAHAIVKESVHEDEFSPATSIEELKKPKEIKKHYLISKFYIKITIKYPRNNLLSTKVQSI